MRFFFPTQQWLPAGEAPPYSKEPPAANNRPVVRQVAVPPAADEEAKRGRAMEAAMKAMLDTGGETVLQLLKNQGHQEVVGMLTGGGLSPRLANECHGWRQRCARSKLPSKTGLECGMRSHHHARSIVQAGS